MSHEIVHTTTYTTHMEDDYVCSNGASEPNELRSRFGRRVGQIVCAASHDPGIAGYSRRKAALRDQVAHAGEDALSVFAADKLSKVRELRLDEGSGAIKVRNRRLRHYRLSLAMLQERLPDSPLVAALATELDAVSTDRRWSAH